MFADAMTDRASGIIVAHDHTSGPLEPSHCDIEVTIELKSAVAIVGIELLDHIIVDRTS